MGRPCAASPSRAPRATRARPPRGGSLARVGTASNRRAFSHSRITLLLLLLRRHLLRASAGRIRLFLSGFEQLTPTFRNVNNKFCVKYFLNLVLIDEEDRRYFKQQEVGLYRREAAA